MNSSKATVAEAVQGVRSALDAGSEIFAVVKRLEYEGFATHEADQMVAEAQDEKGRISKGMQETLGIAPSEACTELGNGKRLVTRHGHEIRYVAEAKSWLAWDGRLWVPGAIGAIERHAHETTLSIYDEAKRARSSDKSLADKLAKWGSSSSSAAKVDGMIKVARSNERVEAAWDSFDANPWALNVQNGILDLRAGKLRPHDPDEMHSKIAGASFTAEGSPSWEAFLEEVLPDADVRHYVHKLAGYSTCGEIGEHVLAFPYGGGANGKSVFLSVIRKVLGDYATEAAPDLLVLDMSEAFRWTLLIYGGLGS